MLDVSRECFSVSFQADTYDSKEESDSGVGAVDL
jgi:hypothetical protein